jgi:hypothetical protein
MFTELLKRYKPDCAPAGGVTVSSKVMVADVPAAIFEIAGKVNVPLDGSVPTDHGEPFRVKFDGFVRFVGTSVMITFSASSVPEFTSWSCASTTSPALMAESELSGSKEPEPPGWMSMKVFVDEPMLTSHGLDEIGAGVACVADEYPLLFSAATQ